MISDNSNADDHASQPSNHNSIIDTNDEQSVDDNGSDHRKFKLTYLEFYSGIGGWTMALEEACCSINNLGIMTNNCLAHSETHKETQNGNNTSRCENSHDDDGHRATTPFLLIPHRLNAFDHSDLCNSVFHHNFNKNDKNERANCGNSNGGNNHVRSMDSSSTRKRKKKSEFKSNKNKDNILKNNKPIAIERLSKKKLEEYDAAIWMMSPPCQPHTRQHSNQKEDISDPRSKSFLHLCNMIREMNAKSLPSIILLENVIGFEKSVSCNLWRKALSSRSYSVGHFHLTPTQFGIPNDRPRYYCVAVLSNPKHRFDGWNIDANNGAENTSNKRFNESINAPIYCHIENDEKLQSYPFIWESLECMGIKKHTDIDPSEVNPILSYIDPKVKADICADGKGNDAMDKANDNNIDKNPIESLLVPPKILNSNASWCFDIVTPMDRRSACFTQSYGKFVRGTGSVLYMPSESISNAITTSIGKQPYMESNNTNRSSSNQDSTLDKLKLVSPDQRSFDENWYHGLDLEHNLRYFSGAEMASLMGFPSGVMKSSSSPRGDSTFMIHPNHSTTTTFSFPSNCSLKQQWKLLGNSLNVKVAAKVVEVGIRTLLSRQPSS